jgi:glycosyltransferase A (GT-A) superfamily protein (DUF2064 family)
MDTPQLAPSAFDRFDPDLDDACLGLASDGGYWSIGFADPAVAARAIRGVPMSTGSTGSRQLRRMLAQGLGVRILETLTDVDTPETAFEVARSHPGTRFAAEVRRLSARAPRPVAPPLLQGAR